MHKLEDVPKKKKNQIGKAVKSQSIKLQVLLEFGLYEVR